MRYWRLLLRPVLLLYSTVRVLRFDAGGRPIVKERTMWGKKREEKREELNSQRRALAGAFGDTLFKYVDFAHCQPELVVLQRREGA